MDPLATLSTALADRYHVDRQIGVGGMAIVFLARDLRHGRPVALKLLRPELAAVLGVERFLSEIRVTAILQHPHLLPLFDSGEVDGLLYYVMPYVEGESLRQRLDREKQLPVDEAVRLAVTVAGALDYAHRHQVVHRDLKPENILLHDGQPVVSDFGIALAVTNAGGTRVTQTGLSLGTPQYMSPEQATGDRVIDARSDIYSLAAVLYEMLTGEPPHTGPTVQAIIARVVTERPRSVRALRETVPEHVDAALQRALAKLPADRFATAQRFAEALQDPRYATASPPAPLVTTPVPAPAPAGPARRRAIATAAPWLVAGAAVALAAWNLTRESAPAPMPAVQLAVLVPGETPNLVSIAAITPLAVSADGRRIAFLAVEGGASVLYLRDLGRVELQRLPATEGARAPFFSPDGRLLGFVVGSRLRAANLESGSVETLATLPSTDLFSPVWGDDGLITLSMRRELWRVAARGGTPERLTALDSATALLERHISPSLLPNGRLVFTRLRGEEPTIAVLERDGTIRLLPVTGAVPRYVASGHLLFNTVAGALMAVPFDADRAVATGDPFLVHEGLAVVPSYQGIWDASPAGTLAFAEAPPGSRIVTIDRAGRMTVLYAEVRRFRMPRVSPDGNRIAVQVDAGSAATDLWMFDRRTGSLTRFTTSGSASDAVWTPDGQRVAFAQGRTDGATGVDILWQRADRSTPPESLLVAPASQWPWSFTPDGKTLVFDELRPHPSGGLVVGIRAVGIGAAAPPRDVVFTGSVDRLGKLSPDGQWLAYTSNESGRTEVYVRPFPGPGGAAQISTAGGTQPVWSPTRPELFYRDGTHLVVAALALTPDIRVISRTPLFEDTFNRSNATNYDVLPNGSAFVMLQPPGEAARVIIMANWIPELLRRDAEARSR